MRRAYLIGLTLLLAIPSGEPAAGRDVKEIGLRAMRKGRIATTKPARDFTRIPADVNYAPDRLLVRFAPNPDLTAPAREQKERILSSLGGSIQSEYDLVPGLTLVILPPNQPVNEDTLRRFNNMPGILYAEPDYEGRIAATPGDEFFSNQWSLYDPSHPAYDTNAKEAWDITTGSDDIVVAVLDTGVNYNHDDLAGNMWVNAAEYNGTAGVDDDLNGYVDDKYGYDFCTMGQSRDSNPMDAQDHGSHVAGIIGALANNWTGGYYPCGIVGVCWEARLMAVKWMNSGGSGYSADAIASIQYGALMGAHVINASWRFTTDQAGLQEAITALQEANITFVAAAGNDSDNLDTSPAYPAAYACDNMITVLATDPVGVKTSYSNYSATKVDLGAPSSGDWGWLIPYNGILSCRGTVVHGWVTLAGTSQAAPHVTGACALLLSINPSLSYTELKNIIMSTVTPDASLSGYCVTGGLLNLYGAVTDPDAGVITNPSVLARDSSGVITAWFDRRGNLVLTGALLQNQTTYPALNGIKIKNSAGTVVGSLDRESGEMRIAGQCHEFQDSPLTPTNARWVFKDSTGAVLAYLNSSGHLYMLGEVFDGI